MAKKQKKVSQAIKNLKAGAAGLASATAGRARVFDGKKEKLAKLNTGDAEIDEGIAEYAEKTAPKTPETDSIKVIVEFSVDPRMIANRFGIDTADKAVQHWIENETKWPDFVQCIAVVKTGFVIPIQRKKLFQ
jgi:hypothetical protein